MAVRHCTEGDHDVKVGTKRGERFCPDHPDCELRAPRKKEKQPGRKGTPAYDRARRYFKNTVCQERCFFSDTDDYGNPRREGHYCSYPLDAHHLVPKQFIEREFSDLPAEEFLAIIFNPLVGAPLCRIAHEQVTRKGDHIYRDELRVEAIEFCESVDRQWGEILLPSGVKRQSMLARLELESPELQEVG